MPYGSGPGDARDELELHRRLHWDNVCKGTERGDVKKTNMDGRVRTNLRVTQSGELLHELATRLIRVRPEEIGPEMDRGTQARLRVLAL